MPEIPLNQLLKNHIAERVTLVKHRLLSAHYQSRWSVVGLQQIINRLFMLLQKRCVIVLLEKTDGLGYRIVHHTCLDPFWKHDFEKYLKDNLYRNVLADDNRLDKHIILDEKKLSQWKIQKTDDTGRTFYEKSNIKDFLIDFYESKFFMLHEATSNKDKDPFVDIEKRSFLPISIKEHPFLWKLAKEFNTALKNPRLQNSFKNGKIDENVSFKLEDWESGQIRIESPQDLTKDWPGDVSWPEKPKPKKEIDGYEGEYNFFEDHFHKIKTVFNYEYKRIRNSPLLTGENNIPNIFFSIRTYSQKEKRFRYNSNERLYSHSTRLLIPDAQREDLKTAFQSFGDKYQYGANEKRPRIKDVKENQIYDDFFWENLKRSGGIDEILDTLEKPYGLQSRAMSDGIFESGYVNIRVSPLVFGGTNRFEQDLLDSLKTPENKKQSLDYQAAVYLHYMLLILYSQRNDISAESVNDFSILLMPCNVGGSPFFCVGFVFENNDKSETERNDEEIMTHEEKMHQSWLDKYHVYYSIRHFFLMGVRNSIEDLYLNAIKSVYEDNQKQIIYNISNNVSYDPEDVCHALNPKFKLLSRVYPFEYIAFKAIYLNDEQQPMIDVNLYDGIEQAEESGFIHHYLEHEIFKVCLHKNPFFVRYFSVDRSISNERFKETLSDAFKNFRQELISEIQKARLKNEIEKSKLH